MVLITRFTYSQELRPNTIVKTNKASFKIEAVKMQGTVTNGLAVININNSYHGKQPKIFIQLVELYAERKKGSIVTAFKHAFSLSRLIQLRQDHGLNLTLYLAPSGKIVAVDFVIQKNNLITASELEKLENSIKNNVSFHLRPQQIRGADFLPRPFSSNFKMS
jgi:hypothetical protein